MPDIIARPLATDEEIDTLFQLGIRAFVPDVDDVVVAAADWRRGVQSAPAFDPCQLRGAFAGETFVGGYIIYERRLRLAGTWFRMAGLGGVVTHPERRMRGVATAMMQDAIAFAQDRRDALLLLDGIPNFYWRWGYVDVIDLTDHFMTRVNAGLYPESPYAVRHFTTEDAPAILELYQRHYGQRSGGCERDAIWQAERLSRRPPNTGPWVATDPQGGVRGYLYARRPPQHWHAVEVAADDWPAALALLKSQSRWFADDPAGPVEIAWPLPRDSVTYYLLADHFDLRDVPANPEASHGSSLRTQTYTMANGGWQARPGHWGELWRSLLPVWHRRAAGWTGVLALVLDGDTHTLEFTQAEARVSPAPLPATWTVQLGMGAFTQLLFGYRPLAWIAARGDLQAPPEATALLEKLFVDGPACIAGTDGF
jgi:predicted N-acetyltransferase YhbS